MSVSVGATVWQSWLEPFFSFFFFFFPSLCEDSQQCNYRMCECELCSFPAKWTHDVLEQEFKQIIYTAGSSGAHVETRRNTKKHPEHSSGLKRQAPLIITSLSFLFFFFFFLPAGTPATDSRRKRVSPVQPRLWSRITISTWKEDNQEFKERKKKK